MRTLRSLFIAAILIVVTHIAVADNVLQTLNGDDIALSSLKGKWVFINYWASWCRPCIDEIAELNRFYEHNRANNVVVFAVNYDALPTNKQQRMVRKFNIRYPSLKQNPAALLHLGDISVVPITFVLNPRGQLIDTLYGGQTMASLNEVIASH